jgi:hypothetical protein
MSDGPHKSLNMRRGWKRLAERADKNAYALDELCEAIPRALEEDWRVEVPRSLQKQVQEILRHSQASLFGDNRMEKLEALKNQTAGYPFASVFLDCAIQVVAKGKAGDEALVEAASAACMDRAARCMRQVEEHYYRKSSHNRAVNVRERMKEGMSRTDFQMLSRCIISDSSTKQPKPSRKRTGLDDGVSLS